MSFKKKRLAVAITVYWILLAYIVAGMVWWFIALETQNLQISVYQRRELRRNDPQYAARSAAILTEEKKQTAAYVGEGSTYLLLIVLGAVYVYREVRRQIRLQQQQQNFMMALTHELKTPIAVTKLNLETLRKHKLDEQRQEKMIQSALQETDRLDVLANIAGVLRTIKTSETSLELFLSIVKINLGGTFLFCREALPHLVKTRGNIVNTASTSAFFGHPYMAAYASSKGGIASLTRTLAWEYMREGVRVNAVAPGGIDTPLSRTGASCPGSPPDKYTAYGE